MSVLQVQRTWISLMILGLLGRLRRQVRLALLLVALMQIIDLSSFAACLLLGISVSVLLLSFQTEYSVL